MIFSASALTNVAFSQIPSVLRTQVAGGTTTDYNLSDFGRFRQVRIQATSGAASGRTWSYGTGTAVSPSFTRNWRPVSGTGTQVQIPGFNQLVIPATGNPPAYGSATTNGSGGGIDGTLPAVTSSRYYTFNISENSTTGTSANESMSIMETGFNPVSITSVSPNTTSPVPNNSVLVTITTSSAPATGELLYVRYSTSASFATSAIAPVTMSGSTGTAILPCQSAGTVVYYYAFSTTKTSAQLSSDVSTGGQIAYDLATLQINNNATSNYSYTVVSGSTFSGVYSVPSSCYPTLASFVSALNAGSIAGPVDVWIERGYIETAPALGINLTATGTSSSPIRFLSRGSGPKPLINAGIGSNSLNTSSSTVDFILGIHGGDFITIDGLNFADSNASGASQMEAGILVFRASTINASQKITISNCRVWFRNPVMSAGPTLFENGNKGIAFVGAVNNALTTTTVPVNTAGRCENITLESDTVLNAYTGILVRSSNDAAFPYTFIDQNVTIGGNTSSKGCVITGFVESGIKTYNINNLTVSFNRINNNNQSGYTGMPASTTVNGIWFSGQGTNNVFTSCLNNIITASNTQISGSIMYGIRSESLNGGPESRMLFNDNTITGLYNSLGSVNGIVATAFVNKGLQILRNTIDKGRCASTVTTDRFTAIATGNSSGANEKTLVRFNTIQRDTAANAFTAINFASTSGWVYFKGYEISRNTIGGHAVADGIVIQNIGTNSYGIINSSSARLYWVDSNSIIGFYFGSGSSGTSTIWGYYDFGSPANGMRYLRGNTISKIFGPNTISVSNSVIGLQYATASTDNARISQNIISRISGFTSIKGLYTGYGDLIEIDNNIIDSFYTTNASVASTAIGIDHSASGGDSTIIRSNIVSRVVTQSSSTSASIATGMNLGSSAAYKIYTFNNVITDISNQSSSGYARGLNIPGTTTTFQYVWNNRIGNISAPSNSVSTVSATGIEVNGGGSAAVPMRIFNNTIYLNTSGSNSAFSTAALLISGSTTFYADIFNNILYNTSTPGSAATAFSAAIWKTTTGITNTYYTNRCNNNLFFTNASVKTKYPVYRNNVDGITDSTLCQFTARLAAPRELNSAQASVSFLSTSGTSPNFLLVNQSVSTFAEGGGFNRLDFLVPDVQGQTRNLITPDIGADEFSGLAPSVSTASYTASVTQNTATVNPGVRDAVIIAPALTLSSLSSSAPANINRLRFSTTGTTSPSTSIDTAKLWFNTTSGTTAVTPVLLGTVVNPNGGFAFNISERVACAGTVNFLVTYGVKCPGAGTFVLDCQLDSVYISGVGSAVTTTVGAPTGTRSINTVGAGMSGTYTVGGTTPNYATLALAVTDVNARGLSGPVILEVRNGHTERAAAATGITLDVNPPLACGATRPNKNNTLTIRRASGSGSVPIIYAGTGVALSGATTPDGIFKIVGEDYVTIDGISFKDTSLNTTTTQWAEYGILLVKKNINDACKRVVIRNCNITLNRNNIGTAFTNRYGGGSVGILVTNIDGVGNTGLTPTRSSGTVDSVMIRNNIITNVYQPILWYGVESSDRNYFWKDNRDSIVNNVMNNFGGSTVETNGLMMMGVDNYFISGNTIDNKANGGVDHLQTASSMFGIRIGVGSANTTSFENFTGGSIINNTIVWNHAPTAASTTSPHGAIGIYTGGRYSNLTITGNKFINSNFNANSAGTLYGVYLASACNYNQLNISKNRLSGINISSTTKTFYGVYATTYAKNRIVDNDTIINIFNNGSSTGTAYGCYIGYTSTTPGLIDSAMSMSNNVIQKVNYSPLSTGTAGIFYGLFGSTSGYVNCNYNDNLIRNINGFGSNYGIYSSGGNLINAVRNTVDSIATVTFSTSVSGYPFFITSTDSIFASQNTITRVYGNGTTSSAIYGLLAQTCRFAEISRNKVADINATGASTTDIQGVRVLSDFGSLIYNNIIGDIKAPTMSASSSYLTGMLSLGAGIHRIFYNTVYLNSTSSGTDFNSAALYLGTSTGRYTLNNNILYNTSTPNGLGRTVALQKIGSGLDQTAYNAASNNNLFYAGTPGISRLIYRNVTDLAADQTICDFLNRSVLTGGGIRDAYSMTNTLSFSSTTPTNTNYLHINNTTATAVEGTAAPITGIDKDFDGDNRNSIIPDIGADEGNFTPLTSSVSVSDTLIQIPGGVSQGARNIPIFRFDMIMSGATNTPNFTSLRFSTAGTTNPGADLDSAKILFTGTSPVFSANATRFGSAIVNPSGTMTFTGNLPIYCNDTFFFWLVYDVKCGNGGDSIDGSAIDFVLGGTTYSITPSSPAGKRAISSPMSGTFTVGGISPDFNTLSDALTQINLKGLSGSVVLNVRAGHTEVAPVDGLQLYINSSCPGYRSSKSRPIIIRKSGTGANPKIFGYKGTSTLASASPDGIFKIIGEDWVTIDGIDLEDTSTSTSNTTLMEWGYALLNSSSTDGCKRVVIKNATIKMSKNQRESGVLNVGGSGSKAVLVSNLLPTSNTSVVVTAKSGSHDSCLFSNLIIQRCQSGIWINGYNDPISPFSYYNQRDSIVNCRITNFGTTDAAYPLAAQGIRVYETNNVYIKGNNVDNLEDGGLRNNAQLLGIAVTPSNANGNQSVQILNNVVRVGHTAGIASVVVSGIYVSAGGSGSRVDILDNKVWKSSGTASAFGIWYGIRADSRPGILNIERDTVMNDTFLTSMYSLYVAGAGRGMVRNNVIQREYSTNAISHFHLYQSGTSDTMRILNNLIGDAFYPSASTVYGIYALSAVNLEVSGNTINQISSNTGGTLYGIYTSSTTNGLISNNTIQNANLGRSTSSYVYGIYSGTSGANYTVRDNILRDLKCGYSRYGIFVSSASILGRISNNRLVRNYSGNYLSNVNYHFYLSGVTGNSNYFIDSNIIENDTILNGYIYGYYLINSSNNNGNIRNNTWQNSINIGTSTHYPIYTSGSSLRNLNITGNVFTNDSFGTSSTYFGYIGSSVNGIMNFNNNRVSGCKFGGPYYGVYGISSGRYCNYNFNSFSNNTYDYLLYGIYATSSQRYKQIIGDTFTNNRWRAGTATTFYNVYLASSATTDTSVRVEGNVFNNYQLGSTSMSYYGIYNNSSANTSLTERYSRNRFSDIRINGVATGSGVMYGIYNANGASSSPNKFLDSNTFHNLNNQGTGLTEAIYCNYNFGNGHFIRGNNIDSLVSGNSVTGIEMQSIGNKNYTVTNNKIGNLIVYGTAGLSPTLYGIRYGVTGGGTKLYLNNNLVGGLNTPANSPSILRAITAETGSSLDTLFIDHNSIFLNSNTTGANMSATGIFASTTPNLMLRNNLIENSSVQKGTGRVIAFQRSSSILTSFVAGSNGNSFFAGTPGVNNLIFSDGINNSQTLAAYKTLVGSTREAQSVSVDAVFQSSVFATDSFLRLRVFSPVNCALNRGGVPVPLVSRDYWNTARSATTPDIGAHEFDNTPAIVRQPKDSTICPGGNAAFTVAVNAGANASYRWFKNGVAVSNGGTISGATSATLQFTGAVLSDSGNYTVKVWLCGNDTATSTVARLRVLLPSSAATAINSSLTDTICLGRTTTLTPNGGFRGAGAVWSWFTAGCGTTLLASGNSVNVAPAVTTTYFLRAEGTCNTTTCASINIVVQDTSVPATSITGTGTICLGSSTTLTVNGGSLGQAASWKWYSGSCGGTPVGTGSSISVSPTTAGNTTYFVRAEGKCNNTICRSYTVTARDTSIIASSITGTTTICPGQSTTITATGGNLGAGASWKWYGSSCGGTLLNTGASLTVSPATTTTYFVRAEGICNTTICRSVTVTVRDSSVPATSITGSSIICLGTSTTLNVSGGTLGTGASWKWYSGSCGGTSIATGNSVVVSPASATTYFVRAEGTCNNTICRSFTVNLRDTSRPAISASTTGATICLGQSTGVSLSGGFLGAGASWKWYDGSCGGTSFATGTSATVAPTTPGIKAYNVRAEGICNNTICRIVNITVRDTSRAAASILASVDSVCRNAKGKLYTSGGNKGFGASWKWYTGGCGTTLVGTGDTLLVTPNTTTRYYVRAEGTCNTSLCISRLLYSKDTSAPATSITATLDSGCLGQSTTLTVNGGSLGAGAVWKWYDGSCGGSAIATGTNFSTTISINKTYYVRAQGACNSTQCVSKIIKLRTTSSSATSITVSKSTICQGETVNLTKNGGTLGSGGSWKWYNTNCAVGFVASGSTISVSPSQTTTYWVRAEDNCGASGCISTTITVRDTSVAASSISGPTSSVCLGSTNNLSVSGGKLGTGASWKWYTSSCGGTLLGTGSSISVKPALSGTNTYFVRAEGTCNNTICRSITVTTYDTSVAPSSINGPTAVCQRANPMVFKVNGGVLSPGASWNWYRIGCGGSGIPWVGAGDSISLTTAQLGVGTHTFYIRAQGGCNTTKCITHTVTISDTSVPASGITGSASTICRGQSSTLNLSGGSLGAGGSWKWYLGSCGGSSIATGTSLVVSPTAAGTYTYFARAEGTCNNTVCRSFTLTVRDTSVPVTSISGNTSICIGQSSTFTLSGGSLGHGAFWKWYEGGCGNGPSTSGTSITVKPLAAGTYSYFVRAEGTCNYTVCKSVTLTVNDTSGAATSITGTNSIVCRGQSSTMTINGGKLGTGATWKWYLGSCGGTSIASGTTLTVTPSSPGTYVYFARAEGTCNNTACQSYTVVMRDTSVPATSVSATSTTLCVGQSSTFTLVGGSLGHNGLWRWYLNNCGGTSVATGATLKVSPTAAGTYTYFVRAEGSCNTTLCRSVTISVSDTSVPANFITGSNSICVGQSTTLGINGGKLGSGASWKWYDGSCGGNLLSTGTSYKVSPATGGNYVYYLRAEGTCNNTVCRTFLLNVSDTSRPASSITGPDTVCEGRFYVLKRSGGSTGKGAVWNWYRNACGGSGVPWVGAGDSIKTIMGVGVHTYYLNAQGTCNTTNCVTKTVVVVDSSIAPSNQNLGTICLGTRVNMNVNGGRLGYRARWRWYTGSCGGVLVGTGGSLSVRPSSPGTFTYFVRPEGSCNTTSCGTITFTIQDTSKPATSIQVPSIVCQSSKPVVFKRVGGSMSSGGKWNWYRGLPPCLVQGSSWLGSGDSLVMTTAALGVGTHTIYLRGEGGCNSTGCISVTMVVRDTSVPASSIIGDAAICIGQTTTMKVQGGSLGHNGKWNWYSGSCGGTLAGTGDQLQFTATVPGTFTFFARAEGSCNNTVCRSFTITVRDTTKPATSVSATKTTICVGQTTTLSVVGGNLSTGSEWTWYQSSCGGNAIGTGASITVSPATTTTYYVRASGPCGTSVCASTTIEAVGVPQAPAGITSNYNEVCAGTPVKLYATQPPLKVGETRKWYVLVGGNPVPAGSGDSIQININSTTDILVRTENACFNSSGVTKRITLLSLGSGTWVGVKSSDWHDASNWCGGVPTSTTDVTISSGTKFKPVITATAQARNLVINSGTDVAVNSGGTLELYGSLTKAGGFSSAGTVVYRSAGNVSSDGFSTVNLEVNTGGRVSLRGDVTVSGTLTLNKGYVLTGSNQVHVTNRLGSAIVAATGNNNFSVSWIAGNLRRELQTGLETYNFPVGSAAGGNNIEMNTRNIVGTSSMLAYFGVKPGNDMGLNVFENGTPYASVSGGGVWYLIPNATAISGDYDLKLYFNNQTVFTNGMTDNGFSILNRDQSSVMASDWKTPAANSLYVTGQVTNGYAQRNNVKAFGQFGIGLTLYPVKVKGTQYSGSVTIQPNPFNAEFAVNMNIQKAAQVSVNVYDQAGRLVVQQNAGRLSGNNTLKVNAGNLSEGTYTVVVKGDGQTLHTEKMVKILK
ncbi:MAG: T9SS C-terminal target domain-containing protein [Bacteroidetes bacterium]|nr:T9SS C-terminal target domain-containing protein [Bacteroidota bacterium]